MADGIYLSTYKRHFKWPPHIPRKTASIEDAKYPDICGKEEPTCICGHKICACPPEEVKTKVVHPKCDIADWTYLKGVKSIYGESYDKVIQLPALRKKHRSPTDSNDVCDGLESPRSTRPNPYLLSRDAFRPRLPRLQACPLTLPFPEKEGFYRKEKLVQNHVEELDDTVHHPLTISQSSLNVPRDAPLCVVGILQRAKLEERSISEVVEELRFPEELQERIARNLGIPEKVATCRARPPAYNNIF